MNIIINCLGAELVLELSKSTPEDYLKFKLMMLAYSRNEKIKEFLRRVFALAEERRPLLLEMCGIAPAQHEL